MVAKFQRFTNFMSCFLVDVDPILPKFQFMFSEDIAFGPLTPAVLQELNLFSPIPKNLKELADIQI